MEKRGMLVVCIVFVCIMLSFVNLANAEVIGIDVKEESYDKFSFKIILYDDNKNKIDGQLDYAVQNFYTDIVQEGTVNSEDIINFKLPKNPYQGPWKITARYKDIEANELFNIGDIKRADIRLEGDSLIIENTGNVPYDKKILISINDNDQTIQVYSNIGQTKRIKLTAPDGQYNVKIDDGEKQISQSGISLTGNVVGLESVIDGSFWSKYPLVTLFLISLFLVIVVISVLKVHERFTNKKFKKKNLKKIKMK